MTAAKHYHLIGIGGTGMSALPQLLEGTISGSDRSHDKGEAPKKFQALADNGIILFPQDGSGITRNVEVVIVSGAVEARIKDYAEAQAKKIPIKTRAALLSELFNVKRGIGISGTSGKTTTTGMTGWMLQALGRNPTVVNGGIMNNFVKGYGSILGNSIVGSSDLFVAEMDESDESIALFNPSIAVLNNITLDHQPVDKLKPLFQDFLARARDGAVINLNDSNVAEMAKVHPHTVTYGLNRVDADLNASGLRHFPYGVTFNVADKRDGAVYFCTLGVPGEHNVSNALSALGVAVLLGENLRDAVRALESFSGIHRRFDILGTVNGVTVIDDYAHNPDKLSALIETLKAYPGPITLLFQPQGFAPMNLFRKEFVETISRCLRPSDKIILPEIYYAGGSTTKNISSQDVVNDLVAAGVNAYFFQTRTEAENFIIQDAKPGMRIAIAGARDDTLTDCGLRIRDHVAAKVFPKAVNGIQP